MSKKQLIQSTIILTFANLFTKFLGFYYRIYMSEAIGAEGMGLYQLIMPLYALAWSVTSSGFTTTVSRLTARESARGETGNMGRIVKQALGMCLVLSAAAGAILFFGAEQISAGILHDGRAALSLRLLAFAIPLMAAGSCLRGFFMGLQQMQVPALSQVLEQIVRLLTIFLLADLFVPLGLSYACFAAVCGIFAGETLSFGFTLFSYLRFKRRRKLIKRPSLSSRSAAFVILSMALPLAATRISSSLLSAAENILIPGRLQAYGYSAEKSLALYGELTGMAMPLLLLPSAFLMAASTSLVPEITQSCAAGQSRRLSRTVSASLLFTSVISVGAACFFAVFPKEICYLIYGKPELGRLLLPLAFLCPLLYGQTTLSGLLNGLGEHIFLFWSHILSSAITIAFVWFAMPIYGISAFLAGWFLSLLLTTALALLRLKGATGGMPSPLSCLGKPLLAGLGTALPIRFLILNGTPSKPFFLLTFSGMGLLYLLLLFLLGCLSKETLFPSGKSL
ncbi:polysaccharide biosynthesis protein [Anaerotignum lactatifermentans]|uniref:Polysaccharide biosynthesis protein n=1 Tax=Anaerotignum lactatifermentans TaxID=160404 RepID=A0ABS2GAQ5_9FIRM|nr:polysaccharide biosynthesis protein [Anaerotignum lactatifermentans]MBM6828314.1 polysaccharide biosynthesis protein [Anaerotignum lactatifermentans]MBM6877594.1 polysaccharide biosynthesis protein [Anaerotignum lactatifermentans]MBM6949897.1 polysaccharide biosynthesis protein [Anaerotignum lactatifermentans]